ncbi:hypothetical protein D4764_09G0007050 [Takifugu flavidus]|uniref:Uncharacterized protein n=1 Tax=Takifugu flavidus TaxID=433684 RepID=A0A5C6MLW0_9TELE|nr:hypothetical protein D4764_09G0007050 [Takifugu flavidus]
MPGIIRRAPRTHSQRTPFRSQDDLSRSSDERRRRAEKQVSREIYNQDPLSYSPPCGQLVFRRILGPPMVFPISNQEGENRELY